MESLKSSSEDKIAPEIGKELYVKHPLQHSWTLWFFKNDRHQDWEQNQKSIISFDTVEDFWALYNHIEVCSKLNSGCDYSLFKTGIKPMWEDAQNISGGRWLMTLDKKKRDEFLDKFWLEIMLCLIGEEFEENGDIVNGAVVSVRNKTDKIGIWLSDSTTEKSVITIGKKLKHRMGIEEDVKIGFEAHDENMYKKTSKNKNRWFV